MQKESCASEYSQRLIGQMQSSCPSLLPTLGQTINACGQSAQSIDDFRKALNRSLRATLANLSVNTMEIRIMLDDYDNIEFWRLNLTNHVLPFLVDNLN